MFSADCILVIRARSLTLFPNPPLTKNFPTTHAPLAVHSFGWVDGVAVTAIVGPNNSSPTSPAQPLSILIRPEPDDPWAATFEHDLDLYVLHPDPAFPLSSTTPYAFPPRHTARVPSCRGSLQCSDLRLGAHGTAVWVEPQNRSAVGLLDDVYAPLVRQNERLVCAAFPGPLFRRIVLSPEEEVLDTTPIPVHGHTLRTNDLNNWKALDYDEVPGRIAVGSTRGKITVLSLIPTSTQSPPEV